MGGINHLPPIPMPGAVASEGATGIRPQVIPALVLLGLALLYVPMFVDFGQKFWWNEEDSHSGILLLGIMWAYYRERSSFRACASGREFIAGAVLVAAGLVVYAIGRLTIFFQLQGLSLPVLVLGLTVASIGWGGARRWLLINGLLIFTIPLLGPLADSLLVPLRLHLTALAAHFVGLFGYLVATSGVIVTVGFVELNIAGACVGLRSMVSLLAIGLLFLHFFPLRSMLMNLLFIAALPVIALLANFLRIVVLIIVAGEFGAGTEAGVHDVAAYVEVAVAVGMFLLLGNFLEHLSRPA